VGILRRRPRDKILRPVRPNAGTEAAYRRALVEAIDEMELEVLHCLRRVGAQQEPPTLARDESLADVLRLALRDLVSRWTWRFEEMAPRLAAYFATRVSERSRSTLGRILRAGGIAIEFGITPAQEDVLQATVIKNVALIRSIPQRYLGAVEEMVMGSVQAGHDVGALATQLRAQGQVTKKRAAFIARDQNSKATAAMLRASHLEAGIDQAVWHHSHAGREPRPTHVRAGREGVVFSVRDGWLDPHEGRRIQPGELINCRCSSRPVIRGLV
jgi:uncharacterized protein with gpF-like domain